MRKLIILLSLFLVLFTTLQSAVFAEMVQGMLKSVDSGSKKLEIDAENGISKIAYTDSTKWPAGVNDPSTLVGKKVTVNNDDLLEQALSVEEI